jgi:hypothetical protein
MSSVSDEVLEDCLVEEIDFLPDIGMGRSVRQNGDGLRGWKREVLRVF